MRITTVRRDPAGGLRIESVRHRPKRRGFWDGFWVTFGGVLVIAACLSVWWLAIPTVVIACWAISVKARG